MMMMLTAVTLWTFLGWMGLVLLLRSIEAFLSEAPSQDKDERALRRHCQGFLLRMNMAGSQLLIAMSLGSILLVVSLMFAAKVRARRERI
jgi:hypothetical protein